MSFEARGPIFEINGKSSIFWTTFVQCFLTRCLQIKSYRYRQKFHSRGELSKMFTSKKLTKMTEIRLSRRALRPIGLLFEIYRKSSIICTTFVRNILTKCFQIKSYESKCVKFCVMFFVNVEFQAIFGAFRATNMKLKQEKQLYLVYLRWKF